MIHIATLTLTINHRRSDAYNYVTRYCYLELHTASINLRFLPCLHIYIFCRSISGFRLFNYLAFVYMCMCFPYAYTITLLYIHVNSFFTTFYIFIIHDLLTEMRLTFSIFREPYFLTEFPPIKFFFYI